MRFGPVDERIEKPKRCERYDDVILYHGSRGGIEGEIQPISRVRCDFGKGFYMGENRLQSAGLVVDDSNPVLYTVKFRLSEIQPEKILTLEGEQWLQTILACRKRCQEFSQLDLANRLLKRLDHYDVIIGPIADDRMTEAIHRFEEYNLTDKALLACLQSVDYGKQYVCKTDTACQKVEILGEKSIYGREADQIREYSVDMRAKGRDIVTQMQLLHQRDGLFLNELVARERGRENNVR